MNTLSQDLRYAIRTLGRTPGFTLIAVITLALGIGANTAIFSVVQAVLLRPLPFPRSAELMALHESLPAKGDQPARPTMAITPPTSRDWSASKSFSNIAYFADSEFILTGGGEPARVPGAEVSWNFFDTLQTAPAAGRFITREEDGPERPLVCVLGHDVWRTRFGSDASLVGKSIDLSGRQHTVVGIAAPGFSFPLSAQIWTPLGLPESEYANDQRLSFYLEGVGRLRPGVTREHAAADLNLIAAQMASQFPAQYEGRGATVIPLQRSIVSDVRAGLLLLLGTVGCVLLIACVNVANLLMARAAARHGEMATRAALGASKRRLVQQLLIESSVLSIAGAVGGVLIALWARDAIIGLTPAAVPRITEVRVDFVVLGFAFLLATVTAVAFGLVPALMTTRHAQSGSLAAGRKGVAGSGRPRVRAALVVVQLALSLALLTGAGLLVRTFWKLTNVDPGFRSASVMTMEVSLPRAKYPEAAQRAEFFARVLEMLETSPMVKAAGGSTNLPLSSTNMTFGFYRQNMTPGKEAPLVANVRGITSGYFPALSIPVLRGRGVTSEDRAGSLPVVVINDAMRRQFWGDQDPIGQQISITRGRTVVWREIVGIVGDIRHAGLGSEPQPEIYMPYAHDPFFFLRVAARSDAPPDVLAGAMRAAVWAVDPAQPVSRVRPMTDVVATSVSGQRFNTILIGTFAVLALTLAAIGLYGVVSYSVMMRLHEFGVRLALGAETRHIVALVLRQSLTLAACGLAAGFALAFAVVRVIENQLYETKTSDPVTLAAVAGILVAIALVASLLPARRAMRVDPIAALRSE
jgi:putative ABC transport system permease protein